ncbi:MAG TPA: SMP-30/gluconolactonase/LRE family protein [Methylomirabilota bacterium]|nr:SMP-30/gluconolactonase/LRE family protein [Methylomirabilota bacterium]
MPLAMIPLSALTKKGVGLKRPEDVVVSRDGRVWASDEASACAEITPDGTLRRVGKAGGKPNGINMDREGRIVIANFAIDTPDPGALQRLDTQTGRIDVLCAEIKGRMLKASNYPLVDRAGNVWCSHSTWDRAGSSAGSGDGFVYRVRPDGKAEIMAEGFHFTNGLAMDPDERHLYVCQTVGCDVVRLPIRADGTLGPKERYGPLLGGPAIDEPTPANRGTQGATDGCAFDQEGNLWVTLVRANKVIAITPVGKVEVIIEDPSGDLMDWPTNVSFGGSDLRDLYIGSVRKDYVLHARSPIPGAPLVHQR